MTASWALRVGRALFLCCVVAAAGCSSLKPVDAVGDIDLSSGMKLLSRPLPGPMAALYRLRAGSTGNLRLSLIADHEWGRMTVAESFGSTLSIVAWEGGGSLPLVLDMRHGCRLHQNDLAGVLGFSSIPVRRMMRLLGGRLPLEAGDQLERGSGGKLRIEGRNWKGRLVLASNPWRVVRLNSGDFSVVLKDHTLSVPGRIEMEDLEGHRIRLDLLRLKWEIKRKPEELGDFPFCE